MEIKDAKKIKDANKIKLIEEENRRLKEVNFAVATQSRGRSIELKFLTLNPYEVMNTEYYKVNVDFYFDVCLDAYDEKLDKETLDNKIGIGSDYLHGVKYSISLPYQEPASTEGYKIYSPDYAFSEYKGIYHEYFGVDENGNVPWFLRY